MTLGVGSPLFSNLYQGSSRPGNAPGFDSLPGLSLPGLPSSEITDTLSLSDEALSLLQQEGGTLEAINRGIANLQDADAHLAFNRLKAVQERLSILRNLLGQAGAEQQGIILNNLRSVGQELNNIGSQIGVSLSSSSTNAQYVEGSFSQEFNGAVQTSGGQASYAEKLNVEFSFLKVSVSEESLSITQTEDGVEIASVTRQTELVVAQLSVESERSLSLSTAVPLDADAQLEGLLEEFRAATIQFQSLLDEFIEAFDEQASLLAEFPEIFEAIYGAQSDPLDIVNEEV